MMVASLSGKITQQGTRDIHEWTSREDAQLFVRVRDRSRLIVMGRATYDSIKATLVLGARRRRIVVTRNPRTYHAAARAGMLEFTNETPRALVARCKREGYANMLVVGGSKLASAFLSSGCIDEVHLTIEPCIFGSGTPLVAPSLKKVSLQLMSVRRLNYRGTLHMKYQVLR